MATTTKTLECYNKYLRAGHLWNFPIITLPIKDIWKTVKVTKILGRVEFFETLKNSIAKEGMHFPVMVVHTTHKDLLEAKEKWGDKICELPFWLNDRNPQSKYQWSVWGGTQRLFVAEALGYTHISCLHMPKIAIAIRHQELMRKPFSNLLYNGEVK